MNLLTLRRHLRKYLDAHVAVQLISAPGLGKSESIEGAVEDFSRADGDEWGLATILAAALTPPDVNGYLVPGTRKMVTAAGKEEIMPISEFTMPPTMLCNKGRPINSYKRGIIFLDEWDKIEPDTKKGLANFILTGVVGQHAVHDGIGFVMASNRPEDRSGSTKEYDFIINRRAELHIRPDVKAWEDWAVRKGIAPFFVAFAVRNPDVVFSGKVPDKQGPYCTPRSLVMTSRLLKDFLDPKTGQFVGLESEDTETLVNEMASGMIGAPATNQLIVWARMKSEVPEFDDIVKDPTGDNAKVFLPKKLDAKYLCCYDLAHRIEAGNADKVVDFAMRFPKDIQMVFGVAAVKRNFRLLNVPAFRDKFVPANQGIIALVTVG